MACDTPFVLGAFVSMLVACGPSVEQPVPMGGSSTEGASSSSGPASSSGAMTSEDSGGPGSSGAADSSTGGPPIMLWTPADHTYTGVGCEGRNGPSIYVEALAEDIETDGSCVPDVVPPLEPWRLILMNIAPWDGQAGTYVVGDGVATAAYGGRGPATGELRVEISEPWVPQTLSFTLDGVEGTLDLTACLYGTDVPCAP